MIKICSRNLPNILMTFVLNKYLMNFDFSLKRFSYFIILTYFSILLHVFIAECKIFQENKVKTKMMPNASNGFYTCIAPIRMMSLKSSEESKVETIWFSSGKLLYACFWQNFVCLFFKFSPKRHQNGVNCDNYVPQWWVELDDELSWLFTNRLSASRQTKVKRME